MSVEARWNSDLSVNNDPLDEEKSPDVISTEEER